MWAGKYFMCFSWWTSLFSFKETLLAGQTFGEYIKLDLSALKESEPFIVGAGRCGDAQFHLHCLLSLHLLGPADLFLGSWKEAWGLRKERDKRQRWSPEGFQWLLRLPQVYYLRFLFTPVKRGGRRTSRDTRNKRAWFPPYLSEHLATLSQTSCCLVFD